MIRSISALVRIVCTPSIFPPGQTACFPACRPDKGVERDRLAIVQADRLLLCVDRHYGDAQLQRNTPIGPELLRSNVKALEGLISGEILFRQRRALIGRLTFAADHDDFAFKAQLAQAQRNLRSSMPGSDDDDPMARTFLIHRRDRRGEAVKLCSQRDLAGKARVGLPVRRAFEKVVFIRTYRGYGVSKSRIYIDVASCTGAAATAQSKLIDAQFANRLHERAAIFGRHDRMFSPRAINDCNIQHSSFLSSAFRGQCSAGFLMDRPWRRHRQPASSDQAFAPPRKFLVIAWPILRPGRSSSSARKPVAKMAPFDFAPNSKWPAGADLADATLNDRCGAVTTFTSQSARCRQACCGIGNGSACARVSAQRSTRQRKSP